MQLYPLLSGATTVAAGTAAAPYSNPGTDNHRDNITVHFNITGGSARSVQIEGSLDGGTTWAILGTAVTTTGASIQTVARVPLIRANVTAVTGSTISVYAAI